MELKPGHVVAAGSVVGGPVTSGLNWHGSCLVPRKVGLPPGPWSVGLVLDNILLQGPKTVGMLPGV